MLEALEKYPKIQAVEVKTGEARKIPASYNIFTSPAILVFIGGQETIREAGSISLVDLDSKLSRYYQLFYN